MLVKVVQRFRRGSDWPAPGELLDVDHDEAAWLIEEGLAVPVTDKQDAEHRMSKTNVEKR